MPNQIIRRERGSRENQLIDNSSECFWHVASFFSIFFDEGRGGQEKTLSQSGNKLLIVVSAFPPFGKVFFFYECSKGGGVKFGKETFANLNYATSLINLKLHII